MAYRITDECVACGSCKDGCPVEAISEGDIYSIDQDVCIECGKLPARWVPSSTNKLTITTRQ